MLKFSRYNFGRLVHNLSFDLKCNALFVKLSMFLMYRLLILNKYINLPIYWSMSFGIYFIDCKLAITKMTMLHAVMFQQLQSIVIKFLTIRYCVGLV